MNMRFKLTTYISDYTPPIFLITIVVNNHLYICLFDFNRNNLMSIFVGSPKYISKSETPRTVKLQPSAGKVVSKPRPLADTVQIMPTKSKPEHDFSTIKQFSTAWRCSLCGKVTSTRKIAVEHLKQTHSKAGQT